MLIFNWLGCNLFVLLSSLFVFTRRNLYICVYIYIYKHIYIYTYINIYFFTRITVTGYIGFEPVKHAEDIQCILHIYMCMHGHTYECVHVEIPPSRAYRFTGRWNARRKTLTYVCFLARKHGSTSEYSHGTLACTRPRLSTRRHRNTSRVR